jgi:diguanylate cyclase (GGDEF)-like protein
LEDMERACRAVADAFGAERVCLWSFDQAASSLRLEWSSTGDGAAGNGPVSLEAWPIAALVLDSRSPAAVDNAASDERFNRTVADEMSMHSVTLVPLAEHIPLGLMTLEPSTRLPQRSDEHVIDFAALALRHSLSGAEAERLEAETQTLLDLTTALADETSLNRATGLVCERLGEHMGVQLAFVFMAQNGRLVPRIARRCDGVDLTSKLDTLPPDLPPFGLIEAVAGSGMPSLGDPTSPLVPTRWAEALGLGSAIAVPLGGSPEVASVCLLYTAEPNAFGTRDVRLASAAGACLGGLVERARALDERHFNLRAASEVRRLFEDGTRAISLEETAEALARVARDAAGSEQATVLLKGHDDRFSHVIGVGVRSEFSRQRESLVGMPVRDFALWHVLGQRTEPVFVEDPNTSPLLAQEVAAALGFSSYAVMPLSTPDGSIGMVVCSNSVTGAQWSEERRRLITQLAYEGSIIVENALLRAADHEHLHELAYQAWHDSLTKLPNRSLFDDRVEHALARADRRHEAVAILLVDIDDFKGINDVLGHEGGDRLLKAFSKRLQDCLRPEDTVARMGGDEFTVLIEDVVDNDTVALIAERISRRLVEPFQIDGSELTVTISIGISVSWPGCMEAGELVRNADLAMYRAKVNGKARTEVFNFDRDALGQLELEAESSLRRAVDQMEFVVHYQPKVDLYSGRIVGMETLVRWDDPERGIVPPPEFIPLAESTGLIVPIGRWVLESACFQMRRWREWHDDKKLPTLYVNLSAQEFQRPTLVDEICDLLARSEIHPWQLGLEITETTMMDDAETTVDTLKRLRKLGVKLALDDFGAGYSSLSYLKRFPVDVLKIDRQFVQGLPNAEDEAIVRAVVSLAQTMGQRVVAEGIETLEHVWLLRELGAQVGQGYYFSKPVPVANAETLIADVPPWMPKDLPDAPSADPVAVIDAPAYVRPPAI